MIQNEKQYEIYVSYLNETFAELSVYLEQIKNNIEVAKSMQALPVLLSNAGELHKTITQYISKNLTHYRKEELC